MKRLKILMYKLMTIEIRNSIKLKETIPSKPVPVYYYKNILRKSEIASHNYKRIVESYETLLMHFNNMAQVLGYKRITR